MLQLFDYPMAFAKPRRIAHPSSWIGHIPFAFALMQCHRPLLFVELGTHTGVSYSAFCQAVDCLMLPTKCYAVDAWKGDAHAGFYGEEVFQEFSEFNDRHYTSFSNLMRMPFDEAIPYFENGTIDLLHIDGCHYYESTKHDFETWLPKMSGRGVVLLHDTFAKERGFGVYRFLGEIKSHYPIFEFTHCWGLGVVAVGGEVLKEPLGDLFRATQQETTLTRRYFSSLGRKIMLEDDLRSAREDLVKRQAEFSTTQTRLHECEALLAGTESRLAGTESRLADREAEFSTTQTRLHECEAQITKLEELQRALERSLTWRLMAPLRQIGQVLGK